MVKDLLAKTQPSVGEFVFMLGVTITFILFITFIDMMIHDGYVRPIIAECFETNTVNFCEERRFELLSESPITSYLGDSLLSEQDDQLKLGGHYWLALLTIVIFISTIMGVGRIVMGKLAGAKTNPMLFIIGGLWSFSVVSLYYFGWLDYLYFKLRDLQIPDTLSWLNGVGLFKYVQGLGNTASVDSTDLYLLMGIGLGLFLGVWLFFIHHHKKKTWKKLGFI